MADERGYSNYHLNTKYYMLNKQAGQFISQKLVFLYIMIYFDTWGKTIDHSGEIIFQNPPFIPELRPHAYSTWRWGAAWTNFQDNGRELLYGASTGAPSRPRKILCSFCCPWFLLASGATGSKLMRKHTQKKTWSARAFFFKALTVWNVRCIKFHLFFHDNNCIAILLHVSYLKKEVFLNDEHKS